MGNFHEELRLITKEIDEDYKGIQRNCLKISDLHNDNAERRKRIKEAKVKRRKMIMDSVKGK
ncbi:MAG: hypothetical protein OEY47_01370 [Candidatus Bathyarchaeota archaeon]|nr:hypothetical protein [Candidatus Bathyarchaeota archaeon]